MNILFLSQRVPFPPNKGDKLRSFNEIKYLSRNHQISLACLTDNDQDFMEASNLQEYCASIDVILLPKMQSNIQSALYSLISRPLTLSYFYSSRFKSLIKKKLQENTYDLIFVFCSSMAQYVEEVPNIPKMIDFVDVDSEKWLQYAKFSSFPMNLLYRLESHRLKKYEAHLAKTFQHCFFVSEKEQDDFQALVYACETATPIQNGVDYELFQPAKVLANSHNIVFTGAMDYFANVEAVLYFVREILPLIRTEVPDVVFYVVGSNPTKEISRLSESYPYVVVTGFVDSIQSYVLNSSVFVAPMRIARGVQNKILEAMAMGVPVVTTSLGFEGISATPGLDIFVEDLPERFANQVVLLLQDSDLRESLSKKSRETVTEYYDWETNIDQLENVLVGYIDSDFSSRSFEFIDTEIKLS